jgi:hypothetical protein
MWNKRRFALLRPRRERPCRCRSAKQHDEVAATDHSITSSARASRVGGISKPSTLAVLRMVGACPLRPNHLAYNPATKMSPWKR